MEVLFNEEQIKARVSGMAEEIALRSDTKKIHVLFVLKGAFIFSADLVRELSKKGLDVTVDYIVAKSYIGKESAGDVSYSVGDNVDIWGKEVILAEDIIDTGRTVKKLKEVLLKKNPKKLDVACFLDKPERRKVEVKADFVGFTVPDRFIVGYGLDHDERYRALPYIAAID